MAFYVFNVISPFFCLCFIISDTLFKFVNQPDIWLITVDWPVESFCCVQTHTSLPGPGQSAVRVQDLTETSLLTVLHDDEELRAGSYWQSQGHIHVTVILKMCLIVCDSHAAVRSPSSSWTQMPNIRRILGDSNRLMVSTSLSKIDRTSLHTETIFLLTMNMGQLCIKYVTYYKAMSKYEDWAQHLKWKWTTVLPRVFPSGIFNIIYYNINITLVNVKVNYE